MAIKTANLSWNFLIMATILKTIQIQGLKMQSCMPAFCWFWICLKNFKKPSLMDAGWYYVDPYNLTFHKK